jgi:hypothetical protein
MNGHRSARDYEVRAMKPFDFLPIILSMSGVKPEPRIALLARGEVSWEDQNGFKHDEPAKIEDRSLSGLCIRVSVPIHVGSEVKVKWHWDGFSGITRYCRLDQGEYIIGIQRFTKDMQIIGRRTVPLRESPTAKVASLNVKVDEKPLAPKAQESNPIENAKPSSKSGNVPEAPSVPASAVVPETQIGQRADSKDYSRQSPPKEFDAPGATEPQMKQPSPGKGRSQMSTKWLDTALGRQKQDVPDGNANGTSVPVNRPPAQTSPPEKVHGNTAGISPVKSQGDLQSMEDIYRAAGISNPRMGYSINKVVDMIGSEHIRGLATEAKRAAVLMALDAAGVSMDEVLKDATLRQEALDQYENDQRKYFEEYWERKLESNAQIQAELDRVSAQYQDRIDRNLEEVTQEKAAFTRWQRQKEQEAERMTEAVGLCSKTAASEPAAGSVLAIREAGSIVKS